LTLQISKQSSIAAAGLRGVEAADSGSHEPQTLRLVSYLL